MSNIIWHVLIAAGVDKNINIVLHDDTK